MKPRAGHALALNVLLMCHFHRHKSLAMPVPQFLFWIAVDAAPVFTQFPQRLACVRLQVSWPLLVRPALCRALCSALTSWACPPARKFPALKARLAHVDVPGLLASTMCWDLMIAKLMLGQLLLSQA